MNRNNKTVIPISRYRATSEPGKAGTMSTYVINYKVPNTSASYDLGEINVVTGGWTGHIGPFEISFRGSHWNAFGMTYNNISDFIEALETVLPYNKPAMTEIEKIIRNATDESSNLFLAKIMLRESIKHARELGVPEEQILKTKSEIDSYFG